MFLRRRRRRTGTGPAGFGWRTCVGGWVLSESGFFDWVKRPASATAQRRRKLGRLIREIFIHHQGRYGYRRVHAQLRRAGQYCDPETVRSIMDELGLVACQPRRSRRQTTQASRQQVTIPDLVGRDFTASVPGAKMVGDITYVRTGEGWVYLALVIDCCSRAIIGWAMSDNYQTPLISDAIRMAARHVRLPRAAVFHSDRGSNYTSDEYGRVLDELGIVRSVGRTGICYDNALAESTNGAVKVELVNRKSYATRAAAEADIASYIELYYNQQRLHSGLGYRTPREALSLIHI